MMLYFSIWKSISKNLPASAGSRLVNYRCHNLKISKPKRTYQKGQLAETLASGLLILKGYRILARRYRAPVGEIDIIAARSSILCFCEVKLRKTFDEGLWAITPHQQHRIHRAGEHWLQKFPQYSNKTLQFDVILLVPWRFPKHIKNAFM